MKYSQDMKTANSLFNPRNIAVIGVSSDSSKLGTVIYNNLINDRFRGNVYPVNPKYPELFGVKCYQTVSKIEDQIDLAVIVIPSQFVFDCVKDCVSKGVKFAIIISAGFKEIGQEGAELEKEIAQYAIKNNLRIIGPNCLGIISSDSSMNASFAAQGPSHGNVAFLSQSGAFNTALLDLSESKEFGFKHFISLGNKSDINELDLFEVWLNDESIKVIGAYIEEFENGRELVELVQKYPPKPIVVLHSGESEEGQKAAASHTGSIAGSAVSVRTAMKQGGFIQVDSIEKMFGNLMMFSWSPFPAGNKVAVLTNAGGPGIIITDAISNAGLKLAQISEESKTALKEILPPNASVNNPIDVLGDALAIRYKSALEIIDRDPNVDSIVMILTPQLVTQIEESAKVIIDFEKVSNKPIIPIFVGDKYVTPGLVRLWNNRIPAYQYSEEAVDALKNLTSYSISRTARKPLAKVNRDPTVGNNKLAPYISEAGNVALPQELVAQLSVEIKLDLPKEALVKTYDEALNFAKNIGYPVVMKATSEDVAHKTDQKLVYLSIDDDEKLKEVFETLKRDLEKITGKKDPAILVQEMIKPEEELIIGSVKDANPDDGGFGHMLLVGKGGIHTEVYKDSSTRLTGIDRAQILEMLNETKVSKVLHGHRGSKPLAVEKVIDTVEAVQKLVTKYPEIKSIDINPCMITFDRAISVDLKLFV